MKVYKIKVNGKSYKVELEAMEEVASKAAPVEAKKEAAPAPAAAPVAGEGNKVLSPIQGTVIDVKVKVGDAVKKGQVVCVVEAMKLENEVVSGFDGTVSEVLVSKGSSISAKAPLVVIK
ncbi:MAG: acetyl-CoA carboxylase biotin carboxyl carrier protein subunit [Bacilli bacterium]|nr:acetyl-CoA carboxylase biotin carboxyl carrier protein subunit [Bacilli bacterium]